MKIRVWVTSMCACVFVCVSMCVHVQVCQRAFGRGEWLGGCQGVSE